MKTYNAPGRAGPRWRRTIKWGTMTALLLAFQVSVHATLIPQFTLPTDNTDPGETWNGDFAFDFSGQYDEVTADILRGAHIVPATNVVITPFAGGVNLELVPLAGSPGGTVRVDLLATNTTNGASTFYLFDVLFVPEPTTPVELALEFDSPAATTTPGSPFTGNISFVPSDPSVYFSVSDISDTSVVPYDNVTFAPVASNEVAVTLQPLTNQSGSVSFEITGDDTFTTNTVSFSVLFKTYPPVIEPISNVTIEEDTDTTVEVEISDVDTPISDVTLSVDMLPPEDGSLFYNEDLFTGWYGAGELSVSGTGTTRTVTIEPGAHMNGAATIRVIAEDDDNNFATNTFQLVVNPVPDPPEILGVEDLEFGDNVGLTNVFADVTIRDVDHNMPPGGVTLALTVELDNDQHARFADGGITFSTSGTPDEVTAAIRGLQLDPIRYRGLPEEVNRAIAEINVVDLDSNLDDTQTMDLDIEVINTPPDFDIIIDPSSITEGLPPVQPFFLPFIFDPDFGDDTFELNIALADPAQAPLLTIGPTTNFVDNYSGLAADIRNVTVTASLTGMTNESINVPIVFSMTDGYDGTTHLTNTIVVLQAQNPPQISGIPTEPLLKTDADPPFVAFPSVHVTDPDAGGQQNVRAVITQSNSHLGDFIGLDAVEGYQTPASLTARLREITYVLNPFHLPVGAVEDTVFTIEVIDATGLSARNSNRRIRVTSVNSPPQITFLPPFDDQPVLIPPVDPILPFSHTVVSNDDTNAVRFTISIDDPGKGELSELGGFEEIDAGVYRFEGSIEDIQGYLTNLVYTVNPEYLFPPDDPGGTTFTLQARDFALLTTTRTLQVVIQDEPRNHLVTRLLNDGHPGSLNYALEHAGNNDVITFALPEYPATIRMPGADATLLNRNVTIKGPGADLLTISGDGTGDGVPNRQIFRIAAFVTIEGLTLSHGTAGFGGAIVVQPTGTLFLRDSAIVDSIASQYGGAIDVDGGALRIEGGLIARNRLSEDTGQSGAGISLYTDKDVVIRNTTFGKNQQPNETGAGGGALVAQNRTSATPVRVRLDHTTFAENLDATGTASAVLALNFGTRIYPQNSIFGDASSRNLQVQGTAEFRSQGGNIADDKARTVLTQQGQSEQVVLLDHVDDRVLLNPQLDHFKAFGHPTPHYPLLPDSPAIGTSSASTIVRDQIGVIRKAASDVGAIEYGTQGRVIINEILFDDAAGVNYVEIAIPRDSSPVDLRPFSLYLDGQPVHAFEDSEIIGTNSVFTTVGAAVDTSAFPPGSGIVVAFTDTPVGLTSSMNTTPVVGTSIATAPAGLPIRGSLSVGRGSPTRSIAQHDYLGAYLDPATGTNVLLMTENAITLAPEFRGYALIPHGYAGVGPFDGADMTQDPSDNPSSPGSDVGQTPFGQDNAAPFARDDVFTVGEDDLAELDVLANDFDADGNDRLVIVDVSTTSTPIGSTTNATTTSALGAQVQVVPGDSPLRGSTILYDPREAMLIQQLPAGVEIIDSFYYEIVDIGSAPVEAYASGGVGVTIVTSASHRLEDGDEITISGAAHSPYNSTHVVTVVDDNAFSIPVAFIPSDPRGIWETVEPRPPNARSQAQVTVRIIGANDPPVAVLDVITNVTERSTVRIMTRPERAGDDTLTFSTDPDPAPTMLDQDLLRNDFDVDTDDSWETLRVYGVLGHVNPILGYQGTAGNKPVVVEAPDHGLSDGTEVLIANYGGHPSYMGRHAITVMDADHFSIPVFYVDNHPQKGIWVILDDSNRFETMTDVGAHVTLVLRADVTLDHVIYDANASAFLRTLSEGQLYTNRFWYAIEDSHGAIGIGPVDVIVEGVNDPPVAHPDPDSLGKLDPIVSETNTLETVLATGLDLMYTLPPDSGEAGRTNLYVLDVSGVLPGTIVLADFFVTDERTPLDIATSDLLKNVEDIDAQDVVEVIDVTPQSREAANVSLGAGMITYDPGVSSNLQALAREEMLIDTFEITVSDGMTDGSATSVVAVLVVGLNDPPIANPISFLLHHPDDYTTNEDAVWSLDIATLMDRGHAVEFDINGVVPDDRLRLIPADDVPNPGEAAIMISSTQIVHDATVSDLLNQLADWQTFTNTFAYAIRDNNFLFAVDDLFYVPAGTQNRELDVLANDRDFTDAEGVLTIVDAGPALEGGTVEIGEDGKYLLYSAPDGFVGDDYFRYIIENDKGDRNAGLVQVRSVVPARNGLLWAADNHFAAAAGETVVLPVTANDGVIPQAGQDIEITQLLSSNMMGQPVLTNNTFVFTAGTGGPLVFDYEISGGGTARARARVRVDVIERRGTLPVQDDAFRVRPGTVDNELDVLANDALLTAPDDNLRILEIVPPGATHGTLNIHDDGDRLLYTPDPRFIGTEQFQYVATDQIGGTGTATVHVTVGQIEPLLNYFTLRAAETNAVTLDVLSNNHIMPEAVPDTLTITNVSPASAAIGTLTVSGDDRLVFTASGVVGNQEFTYTIQDASTPPRTATGRVVIESVENGTYANPNVFSVRGGGSDYEFDVLANDISYPSDGRTYSILSLGTGAAGPDQGGSVTIVDGKLVYTPAEGFFGTERFKYTMSDTVSTDTAEVVVHVRRGNFSANDNTYAVYYELDESGEQPRSFALPVTLNDRIQPAFGQTFSIHAIGVGAKAPDMGGSVSIAADGQTLEYRPGTVPTPAYTETFWYELVDSHGRFAEGRVRVHVRNRSDALVALTQNGHFTVSRNSTNNVLPVLANDFVLPGTAATWEVTSVGPSVYAGTTEVQGQMVHYTPRPGFTGRDSFTYHVSDGLGGTGSATVYVQVGGLPVLENLFTVLSDADTEELDVLSNDLLLDAYAGVYTLDSVFGASHGGTVALSTNQTILYTPDHGFPGPFPYRETFHYRVPYESGQMVTGSVSVIVHEAGSDRSESTITLLVEGRNDPPWIENDAINLSITDKQTALPFTEVSIFEVDQQHQEPLEVTVAMDDTDKGILQNLGDFVLQGDGSYVLTNATAAEATAHIRDLVFEPTENRITVPTTEVTSFTISVTDLKSAPVINTNSYVAVTAVNDPPVISGTRQGQEYYYRLPIQPFSAVTVTEVDDLGLQPLTVTVTALEPTHGQLGNLGSFVPLGNGVFRAENITADDVTAELRALVFTVNGALVPFGGELSTRFQLVVDDGFATPVGAPNTEVIAQHPFESMVRPADADERGSFGLAGDVLDTYAIIGAPNASVAGNASGLAVLYERQSGPTGTWVEVQQMLPTTVAAGHRFGRSVSMHGERAAIGAVQPADRGAVYIFEQHHGGTNNWGEVQRITPTNVLVGSRFGYATALHGDLLAVGAPDDDFDNNGVIAGGVFLFGRNVDGPDAWGEIMRWGPGGTNGTRNIDAGWSVALSDDTLVVGAPRYNVDVELVREGAVFVFHRDADGPDSWGHIQTIVAENLADSREFGWDVALQEDLLIIGAPATGSGRVMLYERPNGTNTFQFIEELNGSLDDGLRFGHSVALDQRRMLIGSPHNSGGQNIGAAYVYERPDPDSSSWTMLETLRRPSGSPAGLFGTVAALGGGSGLVGAPADLDLLANQGYAFLYRFDYNTTPELTSSLSIDPVFRSHSSGVSSGNNIAVSANIAWSAVSKASWITITSGTNGVNDGTVVYDVDANASPEGRSGTITVSGNGITRTFTINQASTTGALTITPASRNHNASSVTGQTVTVAGNVNWAATASSGWIEITDGASGSGDGMLEYALQENVATNSRNGSISFTGSGITRVFSVQQAGAAPSVSLDPPARTHGAGATTGQTVTVAANVDWVATSEADWITISGDGTGSGSGSWTYDVTDNPMGTMRTGTVLVAGDGGASATFTVEQEGTTPVLTISLSGRTHVAGGATGRNITITANVPWTASTTSDWISITDGTSGTGDGTVTYDVAANGGSERSGTITITDGTIVRTFTITQAAATPNLEIEPIGRDYDLTGTVSATIAVTANLSWTAVANQTWISIESGTSGTGDGTVAYAVSANPLAATRTGTITISGGGITRTYTINQTGPAPQLEISPASRSHTDGSATGQVVAVTGNVAWTATAGDSWVTLQAGESVNGSGSIVYDVAKNVEPESRSSSITVSGNGIVRTFTITQAGAVMIPSGGIEVDTRTPVFSWPTVEGATWYQLWINLDGQPHAKPWVQGTAWTPTTELPAGTYRWWVRSWGPETGMGPWSGEATFIVPARRPGPITQIAPEGLLSTRNVLFRWDQSDERAAWYRLWVSHPAGGSWVDQWYEATDDAVFEVLRNAHPGGTSSWWLQGWGTDGFGPWTGPMMFETPSPLPSVPDLVSPIGNTVSPVTLLYTADQAEWYRVFVRTGEIVIIDAWTQDPTYELGALSAGTYGWWIGAWNAEAQQTVWSDRGEFMIP